MELLELIYNNIQALGIHRYGWWFIAALLLIPGVVGVNLCQFYLTQLYHGKQTLAQIIRPFCINLLIAVVAISSILIAIYYT